MIWQSDISKAAQTAYDSWASNSPGFDKNPKKWHQLSPQEQMLWHGIVSTAYRQLRIADN